MRLTIAGIYDSRTGAAAGACHDSVLRLTAYGPLRADGKEAAAIGILLIGLQGGLKLESIGRGSVVEVVCDNQAVICVLGGLFEDAPIGSTGKPIHRAKRVTQWRKRAPALAEVGRLVDNHGIHIEFTHVWRGARGHYGEDLDRVERLARAAPNDPPPGVISQSIDP